MIFYLCIYLSMFANTCFDFKFAGIEKHSIKMYNMDEKKYKIISIEQKIFMQSNVIIRFFY